MPFGNIIPLTLELQQQQQQQQNYSQTDPPPEQHQQYIRQIQPEQQLTNNAASPAFAFTGLQDWNQNRRAHSQSHHNTPFNNATSLTHANNVDIGCNSLSLQQLAQQSVPYHTSLSDGLSPRLIKSFWDANKCASKSGYFVSDTTGQQAPLGSRPRVTTTLWEDEGTLCFQVEAKSICVARREDNNMINGTKLLNVAGMSRGKRDGILKGEKYRAVVKVGAMHLKGVWIPFERALDFANREKIVDVLYPLFVADIQSFLYHPSNFARTAAVMAAAQSRKLQLEKQRQQQSEQHLQQQNLTQNTSNHQLYQQQQSSLQQPPEQQQQQKQQQPQQERQSEQQQQHAQWRPGISFPTPPPSAGSLLADNTYSLYPPLQDQQKQQQQSLLQTQLSNATSMQPSHSLVPQQSSQNQQNLQPPITPPAFITVSGQQQSFQTDQAQYLPSDQDWLNLRPHFIGHNEPVPNHHSSNKEDFPLPALSPDSPYLQQSRSAQPLQRVPQREQTTLHTPGTPVRPPSYSNYISPSIVAMARRIDPPGTPSRNLSNIKARTATSNAKLVGTEVHSSSTASEQVSHQKLDKLLNSV